MPEHDDTQTQAHALTPERFARIRAVFEAALERKPSAREGYVDGACGTDDLLRKEVLRMLAAEAKPDRLLDAPPSHPPSTAPEEGRFPAGTTLAGRYRVLGMLGRGGMGEVYKAHDLILNQAVALKFLNPVHVSEAALIRFRNEVRIARQVSHPNVCRVYDLGMVEGLHFLSMEYIDGEDLASLLRRIGRLPQDKAIEFTRKICAGLGAAHERGVLHRDLKPANIMIDARGQVRITDFGLAALAAEIPLSDIRSGTPAYMSPEQKSGKEVTIRSDIYSLGLVLFEMFTGKQRKSGTDTHPTEIVKDLDPAIERLILRCLDEEPKRRPAASINVAMGLPGADPIAAALAAGETPSPEMVAASQEKEGLTPRVAIACFIATVLLSFLYPALGQRINPLAATLELPPEALAFKAQTILKDLGYAQKPADTAYGFEKINDAYEQSVMDRLPREQSIALLATQQPAVAAFWYRQHQAPLATLQFPFGQVGYADPANDEAGMVRLRLDATGRLIQFEARPQSATEAAQAADWSALFTAAGLDPTRFTPATAEDLPPMPFDTRAAFIGTFAPGHAGDVRTEKVRLEFASWQGKPVYFNVTGDWVPRATGGPSRLTLPLGTVAVFTIFFLAAMGLGWYNLRTGRGDRRGALRTAALVFLAEATSGFLSVSFVPGIASLVLTVMVLSIAGFAAAFAGALYLGIEPLVRRNWPDALISLTRLQSGRLRDSLVASHLLLGVLSIGFLRMPGLILWTGVTPRLLLNVQNLGSLPQFFASSLGVSVAIIVLVLGTCLHGALCRMALSRLGKIPLWIADFLTALAIALIVAGSWLEVITYLIPFSTALWLVRRFGILPFAVGILCSNLTNQVPWIFGSFWTGRVVFVYAIPVVIGLWSLWVILSAQRRTGDTETAS